ncbi:hypothetical protein [Methanococcoides sp. FTZ1]|uniref:hypothetical protein n=1 Tax=Methanococcoides sp. FTZ1 TaxID=3439061 RepID=UPI003F82C625
MALGKLGGSAAGVVVKIVADASKYERELKKADLLTSDFARKAAGYGKAIGLALATASVAMTAYAVNSAIAYESLSRGFTSLVTSQGKDVDTYMKKLKEASHGTVSEAKIMEQANKAMLLGLDIETITQMMEGATVIAQATGQETSYMFESMALGVGRQSRMLLDNLGIIVEVEKAQESYARSIGKTVSQLTEEEKKVAFLNAALDGMNDRVDQLGGYEETAASEISNLRATWDDLMVSFGSDVLPTVVEALEDLNDWGEGGGWKTVASVLEYIAFDFRSIAAALGLVNDGIERASNFLHYGTFQNNSSGLDTILNEISLGQTTSTASAPSVSDLSGLSGVGVPQMTVNIAGWDPAADQQEIRQYWQELIARAEGIEENTDPDPNDSRYWKPRGTSGFGIYDFSEGKPDIKVKGWSTGFTYPKDPKANNSGV